VFDKSFRYIPRCSQTKAIEFAKCKGEVWALPCGKVALAIISQSVRVQLRAASDSVWFPNVEPAAIGFPKPSKRLIYARRVRKNHLPKWSYLDNAKSLARETLLPGTNTTDNNQIKPLRHTARESKSFAIYIHNHCLCAPTYYYLFYRVVRVIAAPCA